MRNPSISLIVVLILFCFPQPSRADSRVLAWASPIPTGALQTNLAGSVEIAAGATICLGLKANGSVSAGSIIYPGRTLTMPADLSNLVSIAVSPFRAEQPGYSVALRSDGMPVSLGYHSSWYGFDYNTPAPAGLTNVVAVSAGLDHALALRSDGTVAGWGYNGNGETSAPADLRNVVAIAAGYAYSMALRVNGTVVTWGGYYGGATSVPIGLSNVISIAAGTYHGIALKDDGTVVAWGGNQYGETNVPKNVTNIIAIASGGIYDLALRKDGRVVGWGYNGNHNTSVPISSTNVTEISAGFYSLALLGDGPPHLTTILDNLTPPVGSTVWLRVAATGVWPLSYQWSFNGTNLPDATNAILRLMDIQFGQGGAYSVTVSNAFGTATSSNLVNVVPLLITVQPQSQSVFGGTDVTFSVSAEGASPISFQWFYNGSGLDGETNSALRLTNVLPSQFGNYSVVVSNLIGQVASSNALLTVSPLGIIGEPQSQTVFGGATAVFSASVAGITPIGYQWQFKGTNLAGATSSTLTLTNVLPDQSGVYSVLVTNAFTSVTSSNATLAVIPLAITSQPQSQSVFGWTTVTFSVGVAGVSPLSYQWRFNGTNLAGATSSDLVLSNVLPNQAGIYSAVVTNPYSTVVSSDAELAISPLGITVEPQSQSSFLGATTAFLVTAAGVPPFGYQWRLNGTNLPGATSTMLTLTNVQLSDSAGVYDVVVSNAYADQTSIEATLYVTRVAAWGDNSWGDAFPPETLTNVIAIAAGDATSMALNIDGTVVVWGTPMSGQTLVPSDLTNAVSIACGLLHCLAMRSDGTVSGWGNNDSGQVVAPAGLSNAVMIAAGGEQSVALASDGTTVGWGQSSMPTGVSRAVAVAVGFAHGLVLRDDGTVVAAGQTSLPVGLTNIVSIASSGRFSLALKADGTVIAWGDSPSGQTNVPGWLTNVVAISASDSHALALRDDGSVVGWGDNSVGQAVAPAGLKNVVAIAAGGGHSLALIGDAPPALHATLSAPAWSSNRFSVLLPTQSGKVYRLEYKNSLTDRAWTPLPLVAGNGRVRQLTDLTATKPQRLYRVRAW